MKTLILYATKYGAAREIAGLIAGKLEDAAVYDLKDKNIPALDGFDRVIVGSSVYAGSVRKEAKEFIARNSAALLKKDLGLFISGMGEGEGKENLANKFPPEIIKAAKAVCCPGGIYDPGKAGALERLIMRAAIKTAEYKNTVDEEKIAKFADQMTH